MSHFEGVLVCSHLLEVALSRRRLDREILASLPSHICSHSPFSALEPSTSMLIPFSSGITLAGSATSLSFFLHIPWRVDWWVGATFVLLGIFAERIDLALNVVGLPSTPISRLYSRGLVREETRKTRLWHNISYAEKGK